MDCFQFSLSRVWLVELSIVVNVDWLATLLDSHRSRVEILERVFYRFGHLDKLSKETRTSFLERCARIRNFWHEKWLRTRSMRRVDSRARCLAKVVLPVQPLAATQVLNTSTSLALAHL